MLPQLHNVKQQCFPLQWIGVVLYSIRPMPVLFGHAYFGLLPRPCRSPSRGPGLKTCLIPSPGETCVHSASSLPRHTALTRESGIVFTPPMTRGAH